MTRVTGNAENLTLTPAGATFWFEDTVLQALTIKNFRAFRDRTRFELRPLTVVFGQNNVGKSTLLRLLPFVADSLRGGSGGPLNLGAPCFPSAAHQNLLFQDGRNPTIELQLTFAGGDTLTWHVSTVAGVGERVTRFTVEGGAPLSATLADDGKSYRDAPGLTFNGLMPGLEGNRSHVRLPISLYDAPWYSELTRLVGAVQWLRATRNALGRDYKPGAPQIEPSGQGADGWLTIGTPLFDEVAGALNAIHGLRLDVRQDGSRSQLVASTSSAPFRVPLADMGEGLAQLLPVLVSVARAKLSLGPRIVCVEQPEIQLHPTAEASLGAWLAGIAQSDDPPTLVLEAHAENMLLSVLHAVVHGRLDPSRLLVYWVDRQADGAALATKIEYDRAARPVGANRLPPDLFTTDNRLAGEIVDARMGR